VGTQKIVPIRTAREVEVVMKETLNLRLVGGPSAPARARRALGGLDRTLDGVGHDVSLLVSELVTNSVLHGNAQQENLIELAAIAGEGKIRVEVTDQGPGFEPGDPQPRGGVGGYGLQIVERLADRWGVTREPQTSVWFEIDPRIGGTRGDSQKRFPRARSG
jgi:signal transduction histidine kinase